MIHRYGSHDSRKGQYRVEELEDKARAMTGSGYALVYPTVRPPSSLP